MALATVAAFFSIVFCMGALAVGVEYWGGWFPNPANHPGPLDVLQAVCLAAVFGLAAAGLLRYRSILRRRIAGGCVTCGYSLVGNVSGICPECGSPARQRTMTVLVPKTLRRRVVLGLTAIALACCAALVVLWVRSYRVNDYATYGVLRRSPQTCEVWGWVSNRGLCRIGWQDGDLVVLSGFQYKRLAPFQWNGQTTLLQRLGFQYAAVDDMRVGDRRCDYRVLLFPYWFLAAITAALPLARGVAAIRRRAVRKPPLIGAGGSPR